MSNSKKYTCPCCGYKVFEQGPGSFEICPICYWEDEAKQLRYPQESGANKFSLIESQENFEKYGVSNLELKVFVRPISENDQKDKKWHKIDLKKDKVVAKKEDREKINIYPDDLTKLYYWEENYLQEE
jgi:hypothetical protein